MITCKKERAGSRRTAAPHQRNQDVPPENLSRKGAMITLSVGKDELSEPIGRPFRRGRGAARNMRGGIRFIGQRYLLPGGSLRIEKGYLFEKAKYDLSKRNLTRFSISIH